MHKPKSIYKEAKKDSVSNSDLPNNSTLEDNTYYIHFASQIKTGTRGRSIKVIETGSNSEIAHFSSLEMTSFELLDNMIRIYTSDERPTVLRFSSNDEAELASERIDKIINGEHLS